MTVQLRSLLARAHTLLRSIRLRLALWFVLILAIVLGFFSAFIYLRQVQDLRVLAVARLEMKARRLGIILHFSEQGFFDRLPLQSLYDAFGNETILQEDDVLAFLTPQGEILQSWGELKSNAVSRLVARATRSGRPLEAFSGGVFSVALSSANPRKAYMVMLAPIMPQGRLDGFFLLGTPIDPDNHLPRLLLTLFLGTGGMLAIALVGGFWLADQAIQPVKQITQTARSISETDLSLRLNLDRKDELGELADTFDAMLARLQAAFDRQRQFTADASHELRTPLTIIDLETSRALSARRSAQEYEHALKVIQSENQFMIRLVNNLLTLARMDAGQVALQNQRLDLSDVTLEVVERLAPLAAKEQVKLTVGELPELPILGDRQYLAQMLTNLVENAIKYTTGEEKRVWVETGCSDAAQGKFAWVRVTDNGPGIPEEHLPHLFDRFYQVDRARTRQSYDAESQDEQTPSGTGLGLSIAQWIAKAHRGIIRVQSRVGEGSTFEVSLPLVD